MEEQEQARLDKFIGIAKAKGVPEHLCGGLARYFLFGIRPGEYLTSFLSHNLRGIMDCGDKDSIAGLKPTYVFVFNNLPGNCWGSKEAVNEWLNSREERDSKDLMLVVGNC